MSNERGQLELFPSDVEPPEAAKEYAMCSDRIVHDYVTVDVAQRVIYIPDFLGDKRAHRALVHLHAEGILPNVVYVDSSEGPGSLAIAVPGYVFRIVDDEGGVTPPLSAHWYTVTPEVLHHERVVAEAEDEVVPVTEPEDGDPVFFMDVGGIVVVGAGDCVVGMTDYESRMTEESFHAEFLMEAERGHMYAVDVTVTLLPEDADPTAP